MMTDGQSPGNEGEIVAFFGLHRAPFLSTVLRGDYADLFLNREDQLEGLKAGVRRAANCAIVGGQGSGKSSLLCHLKDDLRAETYGKLIEFAPSANSAVMRQNYLCDVLRCLLELLVTHDELQEASKVDLASEWQRLWATVVTERWARSGATHGVEGAAQVEGGAGSLMKHLVDLRGKVGVKVRKDTTEEEGWKHGMEFPSHDERSLTDLIQRICRTLPKAVVLYVDELDKPGRRPLDSEQWDRDVEIVLELSRDLMVEQKLVFVFTLQERLLERLDAATVGIGDPALLGLIPCYEVLPPFDHDFAIDYVKHALDLAGWDKEPKDFCQPALIRLVMGLIGGNPRLFANYMERVTDLAGRKGACPIPAELLGEAVGRAWKSKMGLESKHWAALVAVARSRQGLKEGATHDAACRALVKKKVLEHQKRSKRFDFPSVG